MRKKMDFRGSGARNGPVKRIQVKRAPATPKQALPISPAKRTGLAKVAGYLEHKERQPFSWEELAKETKLVFEKYPFDHLREEKVPKETSEHMAHYFIVKLAKPRLNPKEMLALKQLVELSREKRLGMNPHRIEKKAHVFRGTDPAVLSGMVPKIKEIKNSLRMGKGWPNFGSFNTQKKLLYSKEGGYKYEFGDVQGYGKVRALEILEEVTSEIEGHQRHLARQQENRKKGPWAKKK